MSKSNEYTRDLQVRHARESRGLALEFLYTGAVNHKRWSIEVSAGVGTSIERMALFEFNRAEQFAEKTIRWSEQQLHKLADK
jgi:hypothetical protein